MNNEKRKEKKRWVCGGRWENGDVGGKGGVRRKLQNFFFFFSMLPIAAFLKNKNTALGPLIKGGVRGKLQNFFFGVTYSRVF